MLVRSVKGTEDLYGSKAKLFQTIVHMATKTAQQFGLDYLELPKIEYTDLFLRGIGEQTDVVSKELFHWEDIKGRSLCLRPEGTAQTVRFLLEQSQIREHLQRYFYIGSMFRAEKPQKGRLREFHQIGVEIFGESSFLADIEVIHYAWLFLEKLGLPAPVLKLNSLGCRECRASYLDRLKLYLSSRFEELSSTSQQRFEKNPLRILDSKDPKDQILLEQAPIITETLCEKCQEHFQGVQKGLSILQIPFTLDPRLVRGLDYYTRTAFEMSLPDLLGSQDAICGGGRYDDLLKNLSGKEDIPAIGLALGIERLMLALSSSESSLQRSFPPSVEVMILSEEALLDQVLPVIADWRKSGRSVLLNIDSRALHKKLAEVNKLKIPFVVIFGAREAENRIFTVKDMNKSIQKTFEWSEMMEWMKKTVELSL